MPRYNPRVLPPGDRGPRYIRLSGESEAQEAPQLELTGQLRQAGRAAGAGLPGGDNSAYEHVAC